MKNSRSMWKRLLVIAVVIVTVCSFMTACGGKAQTTVTVNGDVKLNDTEGIGQASLNNIAKFMANNAKAYEGVVAAYRGYNILEVEVDNTKTYEEKFVMNEDGSFKLVYLATTAAASGGTAIFWAEAGVGVMNFTLE